MSAHLHSSPNPYAIFGYFFTLCSNVHGRTLEVFPSLYTLVLGYKVEVSVITQDLRLKSGDYCS